MVLFLFLHPSFCFSRCLMKRFANSGTRQKGILQAIGKSVNTILHSNLLSVKSSAGAKVNSYIFYPIIGRTSIVFTTARLVAGYFHATDASNVVFKHLNHLPTALTRALMTSVIPPEMQFSFPMRGTYRRRICTIFPA
jgi:hypothetical protein